MVNGADGIATGWSTYMPCYSLQDVVAYIIGKLKGTQCYQLEPSYNGYEGKLSVHLDENGTQIIECFGDYNLSTKEEVYDINIKDTCINTSITSLEEYLKDNQIEHTKNDGVFIKNVP